MRIEREGKEEGINPRVNQSPERKEEEKERVKESQLTTGWLDLSVDVPRFEEKKGENKGGERAEGREKERGGVREREGPMAKRQAQIR